MCVGKVLDAQLDLDAKIAKKLGVGDPANDFLRQNLLPEKVKRPQPTMLTATSTSAPAGSSLATGGGTLLGG